MILKRRAVGGYKTASPTESEARLVEVGTRDDLMAKRGAGESNFRVARLH